MIAISCCASPGFLACFNFPFVGDAEVCNVVSDGDDVFGAKFRPDRRIESESASSCSLDDSVWEEPADAHHMYPVYAKADQESGSVMESVSGRLGVRSSSRVRNEVVDLVRGRVSFREGVPLPGEGKSCRDNPQSNALYRLESRWVAFIATFSDVSILGHCFSIAFLVCVSGSVMRISYRCDFMARIESVVHAIQPVPGSSRGISEPGDVAVDVDGGLRIAWRSASRYGISWMPIWKRGRRRCGGASGDKRSSTARGIFDRIDRSYTGCYVSMDAYIYL